MPVCRWVWDSEYHFGRIARFFLSFFLELDPDCRCVYTHTCASLFLGFWPTKRGPRTRAKEKLRRDPSVAWCLVMSRISPLLGSVITVLVCTWCTHVSSSRTLQWTWTTPPGLTAPMKPMPSKTTRTTTGTRYAPRRFPGYRWLWQDACVLESLSARSLADRRGDVG